MIDNDTILNERIALYDELPGVRVGDFVRLPPVHPHAASYSRVTYVLENSVQLGGHQHGEGFYLGDKYISYSGGLDYPIDKDWLLQTDRAKPGKVWFFDRNYPEAGGARNFSMLFRVFVVDRLNLPPQISQTCRVGWVFKSLCNDERYALVDDSLAGRPTRHDLSYEELESVLGSQGAKLPPGAQAAWKADPYRPVRPVWDTNPAWLAEQVAAYQKIQQEARKPDV